MELSGLNIPKRTITALAKKKIYTTDDFLLQIPTRYKDYREIQTLANTALKKECAFNGTVKKVLKVTGENGKKSYLEAVVEEKETGTVLKVYWYGAAYLYDSIKLMEDEDIVVCGKLSFRSDGYVIEISALAAEMPLVFQWFLLVDGCACRQDAGEAK